MLGGVIINFGGIEKSLNQFMTEFGCEINTRNIARIRSRIRRGVDESKWFSESHINAPSSYLMYQSSEDRLSPPISLAARVERDYPNHNFKFNTLYAFVKRRIYKDSLLDSPSELEVLVATWVHKQKKEKARSPAEKKRNYRERVFEFKGEMLTLKEIFSILKITYDLTARQKYLRRMDVSGYSVEEAFDPRFMRRARGSDDRVVAIDKISIPEPGNFELVSNEPTRPKVKSFKKPRGHPVFFEGVGYKDKYSLWNSNKSRAAVGYSTFLSKLTEFPIKSITNYQILYCLGVIDSWEDGYYFNPEGGPEIPTKAEFLKIVGIGKETLKRRLKKGMTLSQIYKNKGNSGCEANGVLNARMASENPNRKISIYLAKLEMDGKSNVYKIGITTTTFSSRFSGLRAKFTVKELLVVEGVISKLLPLEQEFKNSIFAHKKYLPTIHFEGKTECYELNGDDLEYAKRLMIESSFNYF